MKGKRLKLVAAGFAIIGGIICLSNNWWNTKSSEFSLDEYQSCVEKFSSQIVVGAVETEKEAIKIAEKIWTNTYGESVRFKKPYKVFYDADSDVWLVQGSLPFYMSGGIPHILIEKSKGKVLAVWHDK